jgi:CBS domain containing-hemolysin-like protein
MLSTASLLALLGLLVMVQAWLVAAEVALAACDRAKLHALADSGDKRAKRAVQMLAVPQVTLATTLVGANLAGLVAVVLLAFQLAVRDISILWAPLMLMPAIVIVGHLVPKGIAAAYANRLVLAQTRMLWLATWLLRPFILVVAGYAKILSTLTAGDERGAFVTRDELALLIETEPLSAQPSITPEQREMIANVFELSEYTLRELMVPLSEVTALPEDTTIAEAATEVIDKQHSRMPVYRNRLDDIVGVVHVFDVLAAMSEKDVDGTPLIKTVGAVAHPPTYVPQTMLASDLLVELQAEGQHLAIVVDEYGGAVGIVTVEDLLETIVGEIDDEYDREPSLIAVEKPGVWRLDGKASVERVNKEVEVELPSSDDYETIAGLLIDRFRRIPDPGEKLTLDSGTLEVVAATDRAVTSVRFTKKRVR